MKLVFICFFLLFSTASFALGRVVSYQEVNESLFASIEKIETCGEWRVNQKLGHFRLITLYYSGQNLLFVDIVALNKSQTQLKPVKGFTFKEINNDHSDIVIDNIECLPLATNKIQVKVKATNTNDQAFEFSLVIDGEKNTYQYNETSSNQDK
jgi:hypothetical protein